MRRRTRAVLDHIGVDLNADVACGDLAVAQHLVEIAKGAAAEASVIIYDEPTAALDAPEFDKLVRLIGEQKKAGKLIFYISHRLDEIFRLCDTTTVLKDGKHVLTCPTADLTRGDLVSLMVGRELGPVLPEKGARLRQRRALRSVSRRSSPWRVERLYRSKSIAVKSSVSPGSKGTASAKLLWRASRPTPFRGRRGAKALGRRRGRASRVRRRRGSGGSWLHSRGP